MFETTNRFAIEAMAIEIVDLPNFNMVMSQRLIIIFRNVPFCSQYVPFLAGWWLMVIKPAIKPAIING